MKRILFILSFFVSVCHAQNVGTIMRSDITKKQNSSWHRKGVILTASIPAHENNLFEPSVIRGVPAFLTGYDTVFKMVFTGGWDNANLYIVESPDGKTDWTTPVLVAANHGRGFLFQSNDTLIIYSTLFPSQQQVDRIISVDDGASWSISHADVVPNGSTGQWNEYLFNMSVLPEAGTWSMWIEGRTESLGYRLGLYTSTNHGVTWTAYGSNPLPTSTAQGGPWVTKIGTKYWMWAHGSGSTDNLPSDIYRLYSTDKINWTQSPTAPVMPRRMADEGAHNAQGQLADWFMVPVGNSVYAYYSATRDGDLESAGLRLKLAVMPMTLPEMVQTDEGDGDEVEASSMGSSSIGVGILGADSARFTEVDTSLRIHVGANNYTIYFNRLGSGGGSGNSGVQNYFNRVTNAGGTFAGGVQAAVEDLYDWLVANDELDAVAAQYYPYLGGTAASHSEGIRDAHDITWHGVVTHNANGVKGNGTTGYGEATGIAPSVLTDGDAHLAVWLKDGGTVSAPFQIGASNSGTSSAYISVRAGVVYAGIYGSGTSDEIAVTTSFVAGLYEVTKVAGVLKLFRNGVDLGGTPYTVGDGQPPIGFFLGAMNDDGSPNYFSDNTICWHSIGPGHTDTQAGEFYALIAAIQTAQGR